MLNIFYDENGNFVDFLEERNNEIKEKVQEVLNMFRDEALLDKKGTKKFGFRLLMQIEDCLGQYGIMPADDFVNLTYEDIEYYWQKFHSLMAYYNRYFEIVPNRQSFQLYLRINSRMYKQLQKHQDEDIRSLMVFIEDRLIGKGFSAGENGNANDKAIMSRLKASEVGHNVVSARDEMVVSAVTSKSSTELQRELQAIIGIGDGKKS